MIRQEIVVCQKCGCLKEIGENCTCSEEMESLETNDRNMGQKQKSSSKTLAE